MSNITRPMDVAQYAANLRNACLRRCLEPLAEYRRRTIGPIAALSKWIVAGGVRRTDGSMAAVNELSECRDLFQRMARDLPDRNKHPKFWD